MKGLDAVLIKLQRLIVDGADKIFLFTRDLVQNCAGFWIFFGLRKHESGEFLARERTGTIEQRAVQVFV